MNKAVLRAGNVYRLNNGKVQYRLSGYYPDENKVLLKFGRWPVKAAVQSLQGVLIDSFVLQQYGFAQDPYNERFWQRGKLIVYLVSKGQYRIAYETRIYERLYSYLHQIQNIYHAHTGLEL